MKTVLITGTSKGLGFALANGYLEKGCSVIGISRSASPIALKRYAHLRASVTNNEVPAILAEFLKKLRVKRIDLIINNAGKGSFGSNLSAVDPTEILNQFDLHCVGVVRVLKGAKAYLKKTTVVNLTSRFGSITQTVRGDFTDKDCSYAYRIAKCAQNMLSLCLANDTELNGTRVLSINPGLLKTDSGSSDAHHSAEEAAATFIKMVDDSPKSGIYHVFKAEALY